MGTKELLRMKLICQVFNRLFFKDHDNGIRHYDKIKCHIVLVNYVMVKSWYTWNGGSDTRRGSEANREQTDRRKKRRMDW